LFGGYGYNTNTFGEFFFFFSFSISLELTASGYLSDLWSFAEAAGWTPLQDFDVADQNGFIFKQYFPSKH
jgi:hypothetical protein